MSKRDYYEGLGVEKSVEEGLKWMKLSAEKGTGKDDLIRMINAIVK